MHAHALSDPSLSVCNRKWGLAEQRGCRPNIFWTQSSGAESAAARIPSLTNRSFRLTSAVSLYLCFEASCLLWFVATTLVIADAAHAAGIADMGAIQRDFDFLTQHLTEASHSCTPDPHMLAESKFSTPWTAVHQPRPCMLWSSLLHYKTPNREKPRIWNLREHTCCSSWVGCSRPKTLNSKSNPNPKTLGP